MIYVNLKSFLPLQDVSVEANINKTLFKIETTLGHELHSPADSDLCFGMVDKFLNQFETSLLEQMMVAGVGVQLFLPISKNINDFLMDCRLISHQVVEQSVGFQQLHSDLFFSSCFNVFPSLKKCKGVSLAKFVEVDFHITQPEQAFEMPVFANYMRSSKFWVEVYQHLIVHLHSIDSEDFVLPDFNNIRNEIISGVRGRQQLLS